MNPTNQSVTSQAAAAVGASPAELQKAMLTLTAQWYNTLVDKCGLDAATFQLMPGVAPLGGTSELLWDAFNVVPPLSVTNYYNPAQLVRFSSVYGSVVNQLKPQGLEAFESALGDYYSDWLTYLKTLTSLPDGGILAAFKAWGGTNLPPAIATEGYTALQAMEAGVIQQAIDTWYNGGGFTGKKAFSKTIEQLKTALQGGSTKNFTFDTSTASSDLSKTWAEGETSGLFDFFAADGNFAYKDIAYKAASNGLSMDVKFDKLVTFAAAPLEQFSSDPILSKYKPWFNSGALMAAYQNPDNTLWKYGTPNWEDTFGESGSLQRALVSLVVADGVSITTKINSAYSSDEQQKFQTAAKAGFFPFFTVATSGGWENNVKFDAKGNATVTSNSLKGNPIILGANITPISQFAAFLVQLAEAVTQAAPSA